MFKPKRCSTCLVDSLSECASLFWDEMTTSAQAPSLYPERPAVWELTNRVGNIGLILSTWPVFKSKSYQHVPSIHSMPQGKHGYNWTSISDFRKRSWNRKTHSTALQSSLDDLISLQKTLSCSTDMSVIVSVTVEDHTVNFDWHKASLVTIFSASSGSSPKMSVYSFTTSPISPNRRLRQRAIHQWHVVKRIINIKYNFNEHLGNI